MRPPNGKRGRSRGRNKGGHHGGGSSGGGGHGHGGHNINRTLELNGPDVKIRGNAAHIHEKYLALARDAHSSGDRIAAENYLQHAEHYHRLMMSMYPQGMPVQPPPGQGHMNGGDQGDEDAPGFDAPQGGPPTQGAYSQTQQQVQPQAHYQHQNQQNYQQPQPRQAEPQAQPQQPPRPAEPPRSDGEQALAFDRRLNGRSRRVAGEDRNGRAVTNLDENKAAPANADEAGDDADEALA